MKKLITGIVLLLASASSALADPYLVYAPITPYPVARAYYVPRRVARRMVPVTTFYAPTTAYYAPAPVYAQPVQAYYAPTTTYYAPATPAYYPAPVTTYYAPAPVYTTPVIIGQ